MSLTTRGRIAIVLCSVTLAITANSVLGADKVRDGDGLPNCPRASHLTWFEDGSGACYPDHPTRGELDQYPLPGLTFPEDTFGPWDCRTMGNRICGADLNTQPE